MTFDQSFRFDSFIFLTLLIFFALVLPDSALFPSYEDFGDCYAFPFFFFSCSFYLLDLLKSNVEDNFEKIPQ